MFYLQGHEIQPCATEHTKDICIQCPKSLVQPDLISSSPKGNPKDTECFKKVQKCDSDGKYNMLFCILLL